MIRRVLKSAEEISDAEYSNSDVFKMVSEQNYRLPKPNECPNSLYQLMLKKIGNENIWYWHYTLLRCWNSVPESRCSASQILEQLKAIELAISSQEDKNSFISPSPTNTTLVESKGNVNYYVPEHSHWNEF